jgi:hypothetical protein
MIVAGSEAFVISPQGEQAMPSSIRERIDEQMVRVPLLLLRQRTQPGFEAVAAGEGKAGDVTTSLVTVTLKGNVTTLGLDPTGRIVTVAFRGAGPDGVPGDMLHTYSDFRPAGSLTLPYKQQTTLNGEVNGTATTATVAINQPVDEALWKRKGATP